MDDEQQILALVSTWLDASRRGETDAILPLMSEDVVFLTPGNAPLRGREAFAAAQRALAGVAIDAEADIQEVRVLGDWAWCWNHLRVSMQAPGKPAVRRAGHVLSVLQKQDGQWRIVRDANLLAPAS